MSTLTIETLGEAGHGMTVLGVTQPEWIAAVVAAIVVPPLLGWISMFRRKATQQLPYLLLQIAKLRIPREQRDYLFSEVWVPDLLAHLNDTKKSKIIRYTKGVGFAVSLALYGARATANVMSPRPWRWKLRHQLRLYDFALVGCVLLEAAVGTVALWRDLTWPWVACLSAAQIVGVILFTRWRRKVGRERYGLDA
ncbi:hypothetical protein [Streptomyces arenae]|uniref:hypothetical protein n=1 Tax=Streptomyces arenae TaxID=29301 RepID=UPI0026583AA2|nr:hypothetical protein [Streptomyces arenae]MCG7203986.1 hypothetical protein [Streptomyces arenae]